MRNRITAQRSSKGSSNREVSRATDRDDCGAAVKRLSSKKRIFVTPALCDGEQGHFDERKFFCISLPRTIFFP